MKRPQLTYANVMSTLGVFIALGGTSYAVAKLPRNSVGSAQIKKNAVTGSKVRNGSLGISDLSRSARLSGPRGTRGPEGPPGPLGPPGPTGAPGPAAAEGWRALPFASNWSNYGAPWEGGAYRRDQLGAVHLRGLVTQAGGPPVPSVIATLPPGYRPANGRIFVVHTGENPHAAGRVNVLPNGNVQWNSGATGEPDYTSLDGISFDTD